MDGRQGEELEWRVDRQVVWASRRAQPGGTFVNQLWPWLSYTGLKRPVFCSILGPTSGVRLCFQRIPSCCCQLGKGGERSECVVSGQSCLSEGFHPWSYYYCLSEGQARQRANQREGGTKEIWLLYFLKNFWPFWVPLPLTPNCRVWGVTCHTYLDLSLFLSMFFWTYFLCSHNMYLCSTIKTKQKPPFLFWGWH